MPDTTTVRDLIKEKIKAIPVPQLSTKQYQAALDRNRQKDLSNTANTIQILQDRRSESVTEQNQKKMFHTLAIERDVTGQLSKREHHRDIDARIASIKHGISAEYWALLSQFSEISDPKFWEKSSNYGYDEIAKAQYYRDVWGIPPIVVTKFLELIKLLSDCAKL